MKSADPILSAIASAVSAAPSVAYKDVIKAGGFYDKDNPSVRANRQGYAGGDRMLCQVVSARSKINPLSGETLFLFWSLADGHRHRLLRKRGWR